MGRRDGKKERAVPEANTLSSHFRRVRRAGSDAVADGKRAAGGADSGGGAKGGRGKAAAASAAAEGPAPVASPKPVTPEKRKAQGDEDLTPASGAGCLRFTSPVYVSPSVKRVYRLIDKKSYLDWGLTSDWLTADKRRTPSRRAEPAAEPGTSARKQLVFADESEGRRGRRGAAGATGGARDSSSEGYGEMTEGSIQRLLRSLQSPASGGGGGGGGEGEGEGAPAVDPTVYALGKSSSFIDVGSGYGKVVLHAAMAVPLRDAHGIEYVESRSRKANAVLDELRRGKLGVAAAGGRASGGEGAAADEEARLLVQKLEKVRLISGDATEMGDDFGVYTHVYVYDKVFSPTTLGMLVPQLVRSPSLLVMVTYQRPDAWRKSFRECGAVAQGFDEVFTVRESVTMRTTGGQNFTAYVLWRAGR